MQDKTFRELSITISDDYFYVGNFTHTKEVTAQRFVRNRWSQLYDAIDKLLNDSNETGLFIYKLSLVRKSPMAHKRVYKAEMEEHTTDNKDHARSVLHMAESILEDVKRIHTALNVQT